MQNNDLTFFWISIFVLVLMVKPTYSYWKRDREFMDLFMVLILVSTIVGCSYSCIKTFYLK